MIKNIKKFLLIITAVFFVIVFAVNAAMIYSFVDTAQVVLEITRIFSFIIIAVLTLIIAAHYSQLNRINSDGSKSMGYYLKKIFLSVLFILAISLAVSLLCGFIGNFFFGESRGNIDNLFLRGAIVKIPMFIVYIAAIYQAFVKQGFWDSQRKRFNLHLKILALLLALIMLIPGAILDSMYETYSGGIYLREGRYLREDGSGYRFVLEGSFTMNIQTLFSPNVDRLTGGHINPNFNMVAVIIAVLIAFAIQTAVAVFAYKRGKSIFINEHLTRDKDYQTDEIC